MACWCLPAQVLVRIPQDGLAQHGIQCSDLWDSGSTGARGAGLATTTLAPEI